MWGVRHGRAVRILTFRCAQVNPRIAHSREGVVGCALFRSGHGLLAIFGEPLPHAVSEVRHVLATAQENVQGRALLRLELRVCHASAQAYPTEMVSIHSRDAKSDGLSENKLVLLLCVNPKACAQDCDVLGQNGGHFQKTIEGCRCGGLTHGSTDRFIPSH